MPGISLTTDLIFFPDLFITAKDLSDVSLRVKHCFIDNKLKIKIYYPSYC